MEISSTVIAFSAEAYLRFETQLLQVFGHLHDIYASFDGRIKADNFRRHVMSVTSVWETWMIFNNRNVELWVKSFLGRIDDEEQVSEPTEESIEKPQEKKGRWKSVSETSGKENVQKSGFTEISPSSPSDESEDQNVDGEEMEEDVDGLPMDEENVDGEPMDENEDVDVDGEPMDDDDVPTEEPEALPLPQQEPPQPIPEQIEKLSNVEPVRPFKRQRMRAVDMFTDD